MKSINKLIAYYVCEILVVLVFVGVSIPVWAKLNSSETSKLADMYDDMDYLYLDINKYVANDQVDDVIAIVNDTKTSRNYVLLLKINKNINYENITLTINNEETKLSDIKYKTDENYNYFNLGEGKVIASQNIFNVSIDKEMLNYNEMSYEIYETEDI